MIPAAFDYAAPATLDEACALLAKHGDEAKILTGGHSLIPLLKLRLARPALVIDLRKITSLRGIGQRDGGLVIGAATTHAEILDSALVRQHCPLLAETARQIGDLQVRNAGTIGGSVVHADPAADWPGALLATGATLVLRGPAGERSVPAEGFFLGPLEAAIRPGEILTAVRVPAIEASTGGAYHKLAQAASGFALAGVAALVTARGGRIEAVRLGITGVAGTPYRPGAVESALAGQPLAPAAVQAACARAAEGVTPLADLHASAAYRAQLAGVLAARAVLQAGERAGARL